MQVLSTIVGQLQPCTLPEQFSYYLAPTASERKAFLTPGGNTLLIQYFAQGAVRLLDLIAVSDETLLLQDEAHAIELLIALSNTLFLTIDTLSLTLHERGINILYNPTIYKNLKIKKDTTTTFLSILLSPSSFNSVADTINRHTFVTNLQGKTPSIYRKYSPVIDSALLFAADELRWRCNPDKLAPTLRLLQESGISSVTENKAKAVKLEQTKVDALYRYKKYLIDHLHENPKSDTITEYITTPLRTAQDDFNSLFGVSIQQFVHEQKMLAAIRYLMQGEKMQVIATKLGYKQPSSFSDAFNSYFKLPPSAFQRKNLQIPANSPNKL